MKITVKCYGHLRTEFEKEKLYDLFSDSRPRPLNEIFKRIDNEALYQLIYDSDGNLNPFISVILNRRVTIDSSAIVNDGDTILLVPYVDGG